MEIVNDSASFLRQLIEYQIKVVQALEFGIDERYDDGLLLNYFDRIKREVLLANTAVAKKCADYYQLLREKQNFEEIELSDIEKLYSLFIKAHPLDIGLYEDFAFYLNNVQDRSKEAKQILSSGINAIEAKINELKIAMEDFH